MGEIYVLIRKKTVLLAEAYYSDTLGKKQKKGMLTMIYEGNI